MSTTEHGIGLGGPSLIFILATLLAVGCGKADPVLEYPATPENNLVRLGEWGKSGSLRFKATRVEETNRIEAEDYEEKAPRGTKFIIITLQVMPAQKGEASVDYPEAVRLVDKNGRGYHPSSSRFLGLNRGNLPVKIDAGTFVERMVAFLVEENFSPLALRCTSSPDAEPVDLALKRKK